MKCKKQTKVHIFSVLLLMSLVALFAGCYVDDADVLTEASAKAPDNDYAVLDLQPSVPVEGEVPAVIGSAADSSGASAGSRAYTISNSAIQAKYNALPTSSKNILGNLTSNTLYCNVGTSNSGALNSFQGGAIYKKDSFSQAYATWGGIWGFWTFNGFENGNLGYPLSEHQLYINPYQNNESWYYETYERGWIFWDYSPTEKKWMAMPVLFSPGTASPSYRPSMSVSLTFYQDGVKATITGSRFTPNGLVQFWLCDPKYGIIKAGAAYANASGNVSYQNSSTISERLFNKINNRVTYLAVDQATGNNTVYAAYCSGGYVHQW